MQIQNLTGGKMKTKLMDSDTWIDTKKIIAFHEEKIEKANFKTMEIEKYTEYQLIVPGKILVISKADYYGLHDIWRNEQ